MHTLSLLFRATCIVALALFGPTNVNVTAATLPANFSETQVGPVWSESVGITFAADGRTFVWERGGRVYLLHNNIWNPVIDIRPEVGAWRDHGLLGVALHPNFLSNGQIFLLYVVDRHHLLHFGTPNYNPNSNEYLNATIGRITRYTLDPANNYLTIVPNSRAVLLGESKTTGIPILHESHGVGSLVFGTDGTLLVSCGDGASFLAVDTGGTVGGTYTTQALSDGIITNAENVGAFRAQLVNSHNGKILRIDPNTGNGVPSNPFYDAAAPRAPRSRVWSLGFRNPSRFTVRPSSGSHNPTDGNPGALYIGDVGWGAWEELNIATGPRQNFGWPLYEGMTDIGGYYNANVYNQNAPNPLFGQGGCTQQYFRFRELVVQDTTDPNPSYPNPCNTSVQIPASIPKFIHRRPEIDWGRPSGPARTGIYSGTQAAIINVGAAGSPIAGPQFGGNCSIGGAWYAGTSYPSNFRNKYYHVDYGVQWIKAIAFDSNNEGTLVQNFLSSGGDIVNLASHPVTGDLHYVTLTRIFRITYTPSGNQPPTAVATANLTYGPAPLTVQFNGSASSDPENLPLQFHWNFGDGTTSTQINPSHTFNAPAGVPTQFNVTLTVTDSGNLTSQSALIISANNTPPNVNIVSPVAGSTYPVIGAGNTTYHLVADINDAEHGPSQLACQWRVALHHNDHSHPEPPDPNCLTTAVISPDGCDGNTYFYRIKITVTDAAGLTGTDEIDVHPNCTGNQIPVANPDAGAVTQAGNTIINVLNNDSDSDGALNPATVVVVSPPSHGSTSVNPQTGAITYQHNGSASTTDSFGYTVNDNLGGTSNVGNVSINIQPGMPGDITGDGVVNVNDLLALINSWGICPAPPQKCPADISPPPNGDGVVNVNDLLMVINNWG